jgi:hypothetical protein
MLFTNSEEPHMTRESVNGPTAIRTVRDDICKTITPLRTIDDPWIRNAMTVYANSTR